VQAGGDRQAVHEVIRRHAIAAARAVKDEGIPNDMLERLAGDPEYPVSVDALRSALEPRRFIGRSAEQVDEFLAEEVAPALAGLIVDETAAGGVRV
jgi:adenylosuccinate lyase